MPRPINPDSGRLEFAAEPDEIREWAKAAQDADQPLRRWLTEAAREKLARERRRKKP